MRRRELMFAAVALVAAIPAAARAGEKIAFTPDAFKAAQAAGKPILVHVEASWCPNCAKQRPIIAKLSADPAFADLTVFDVDFDKQKDVVRSFGVQMQSTLIAFHGADERARSVGETHEPNIRALMEKAVA